MSPTMAHAVVVPRTPIARLAGFVRELVGFTTLVVALLLLFALPARAATPGLVGAWSFDEPSGTSSQDLSGLGNHAKLGSVTRSAGKFGQALTFKGSSGSYVTVADAPSLRMTKAVTIEAWVKPSTTTGWRTVVLKERPDQLSYALYAANEQHRPAGHIFTSRDTAVAGGTALPVNTWSHLASTWDGNTQTLYVNGKKVASAALKGSVVNSSKPLRIGGNALWSEWFKGSIDDVRVYNRALSATEVASDRDTPVSSLAALPVPPLPIPPLPEPIPPLPLPTPQAAADTTPPSVPQGLTVTNRTQNSISLRWNASTDNVGVTGYRLYNSDDPAREHEPDHVHLQRARVRHELLARRDRRRRRRQRVLPARGRGHDEHDRVLDAHPDADRHRGA